jgi:hypothetical protein
MLYNHAVTPPGHDTCTEEENEMEYPKAEIGVFGGSGFYELIDNPRTSRSTRRSARRRRRDDRRDRRAYRGVPAPSRQRSLSAAAHDQLPRESLGDEGARRDPHHRAERLRLAQARYRAGSLRDLRSVRGPHLGSKGHLLRRAGDDPRLLGGPVLRDDAEDRLRDTRSGWASPRIRPARWWSSRARASRRAPSPAGSHRRAGRSST